MKEPKDMTDRELIDEYLEVNDLLNHVGYVDGAEYLDSIEAEIERRGITDEQIEARQKELQEK